MNSRKDTSSEKMYVALNVTLGRGGGGGGGEGGGGY